MIKSTVLLTASLPMISYTVITPTTPVSDEFSARADKVTLEAPTLRAVDSVFDMDIGKSRSANSEMSWTDMDKNLVSERYEGLRDSSWMRYDNTWRTVQEFNVAASQQYGFQLLAGDRKVSQTQCAIFSRSRENRYIEHGKQQRPISGLADRWESFLSCLITHNHQQWEMTLRADMRNRWSATLQTDGAEFTFEDIADTVFLDKSGKHEGPAFRSYAPESRPSGGSNLLRR